MPESHDQLRAIKSFPSLVKFLRDELNWPIEGDDFEELTFEYDAEEVGLDSKTAAKIDTIKQFRPLVTNQPWGIFFVKFEPKSLPVVALRRILSKLVLKQRDSANKPQQAAWRMHDLLFISQYGEGNGRQINLAHFADPERGDLPTLKVLGWDGDDTNLKLDYVERRLREKLGWPDDDRDLEAWRREWGSAFELRHRETIQTSQHLAVKLAELACAIRRKVNAALAVESERGPLRTLMRAFQEALIHDLKEDDFADMYAQTIAYGLLTARVSRQSGALVAEDIPAMFPKTSPFLAELLETFLHLGGRHKKGRGAGLDFDELGINDVVEMLREANMEAVLRDFDNRNPLEDPVIHFYELFLKEYDAKKRMQRGVFYTPKPVVSYIVRSVHELLQTEFGLSDGLADTTTWGEMAARFSQSPRNSTGEPEGVSPRTTATERPGADASRLAKDFAIPEGVSPDMPFVQILDPATGTATFLVEVIDVIHHTLTERWKRERLSKSQQLDAWNEYVPRHLLPRLHGYELMMAPYAIAHMKLGLKLGETGYRFDSDERARVFLTNALEPPSDRQLRIADWAPALAHEAQAVDAIKRRQRFTIIIGNPPYSGESMNKGEWIRRLIDQYMYVEGTHLNEKGKKNWLQDDYVKFIRFSQWVIKQTGIGIVGLITNHSYLDNPTFRGMRASLAETFQSIKICDLHGNSKKKEQCPDRAIAHEVTS